MRSRLLYTSLLLRLAVAQTCDNFGIADGSNCACPPGFGGTDCSQPACGGTLFQGTSRSFQGANITSTSCACEAGWSTTVPGCNVCQTQEACRKGANNQDLTCNIAPKVFSAGHMSCKVINPTLQGIYPGASSLNILRSLSPSLSPSLPSISDNSARAQLFYNGVEQFFCKADTCMQSVASSGSTDWQCSNLECKCRTGTTFCGAVPATDLSGVINKLGGTLSISCDVPDASTGSSTCAFKQQVLQSLFGASGLSLSDCSFGECVPQSVISSDPGVAQAASAAPQKAPLSGGVIAGLAVVGGLLLLALLLFFFGLYRQRRARRVGSSRGDFGRVNVEWSDVNYVVSGGKRRKRGKATPKWVEGQPTSSDKVVLDGVSGNVPAGTMMAILGPSGAGKTTLIEILTRKAKSGNTSGSVNFPSQSPSGTPNTRPRIGFVPQQDILPPTLTVSEALFFAARLRLPENIPDSEKRARVDDVMEKLGIASLAHVRIGSAGDGRKRGISGGEARRVSIGLELVGCPDVLLLDEPTSGLDSVSAAKVARVLHDVAHDANNPTAVIASIHQPSSQLYQTFDSILLLSRGQALYSGPGAFAPVDHFAGGPAPAYQTGYNVADYLLEVASDPPAALLASNSTRKESGPLFEKGGSDENHRGKSSTGTSGNIKNGSGRYAATFLTQLQVLSGREWKILRRDKSLFIAHLGISCILGVFCGGLYFKTDTTIAGFQSRVGCLFFLGALIAFSSLSALYNIVEIRPLFLRERSSSYYSPTAWLLSRFLFDVVPLRIIPTIIVSTITYWMAGLATAAANYFKFLFIVILYSLAMTLYNFLLGSMFQNGGIAILISALSALYQMTFAGFFVHLAKIPPVLRWLQWLDPLKYMLEALSVNEVSSGLMIQDTLEGVPVNVSASLIMKTLFGFGADNYYRDVLILFGFIAGFLVAVIGTVRFRVREQR